MKHTKIIIACAIAALGLAACGSHEADEQAAQQEDREAAQRDARQLQLQREAVPVQNMSPQRFVPPPQYAVAPKFEAMPPIVVPGRAPVAVGVYQAAPAGLYQGAAPAAQVAPVTPARLEMDSMSIARAQVGMVKDEPRCEPYKAQMLDQGKGSASNPQVIQNLVTVMTNAAGVGCMKG